MLQKHNRTIGQGLTLKYIIFSSMTILMLNLLSTVPVRAIVPIPSGWTIKYAGGFSLSSYQPVRVYQKKNSRGAMEYVTIVDMRYAGLRSFTGEVRNGPNGPGFSLINRYSASEYWRRAQLQNTQSRKAAVVINGTFFDDTKNPAGIAFGLKSEWWRMSYGYEINWGTFPLSQIKTFAYNPDNATSSIQTHTYPIFDGSWPSVVGGLDVAANKEPNNTAKRRTFVGIRDDNVDFRSETVIFFSSPGTTQASASSTLSQFGASSKMMLDGGTSGNLILNGTAMFPVTGTIPQAFVIYTAR